MRVVVFNLRHGANLGDQLIALCLAADLRSADSSLDIVNEDLAGRDAPPGAARSGARMIALSLLTSLPSVARRLVAGCMLDRLVNRRLEPRWRALIAGADAVVIGGGGIFADSDLNFPKKIGAALRLAAAHKVPVAIHAVGVSPGWSREGRRLFVDGLAAVPLCGISVRDDLARAIWTDEIGDARLPPPTIAPDSALTLGAHLGVPAQEPATDDAGGKLIGLCLTSPAALRYHSRHRLPSGGIGRWYVAVAAELSRRGYRVVGFTTGAVEDIRFAADMAERFRGATTDKGGLAPPATTASELVAMIGQCHGLVAHRLHALIAGYALGIPGLALTWDAKMTGQLEMMGYPDRLVDPARLSPEQAVDRIEEIVADGIDATRRDALVSAAHRGTRALVETLRAAASAHG